VITIIEVCIGIKDGVGYTIVAVGIKVDGNGVEVGKAVCVCTMLVCIMELSVLCVSTTTVGCADMHAIKIRAGNTIIIIIFMFTLGELS
jgi:hypothetical protein